MTYNVKNTKLIADSEYTSLCGLLLDEVPSSTSNFSSINSSCSNVTIMSTALTDAADVKPIKIRRRLWTMHEDRMLRNAVEHIQTYMPSSCERMPWQEVAKLVEGRSAKQCRNRWSLIDNATKHNWMPSEDAHLLALHARFTNRWVKIAAHFLNRNDNMVKSRFRALQKQGLTSTQAPNVGAHATEVGAYAAEFGAHATEVGAYAAEFGAHAADLGEYATDVCEYATEVGKYTTEVDAHATQVTLVRTKRLLRDVDNIFNVKDMHSSKRQDMNHLDIPQYSTSTEPVVAIQMYDNIASMGHNVSINHDLELQTQGVNTATLNTINNDNRQANLDLSDIDWINFLADQVGVK